MAAREVEVEINVSGDAAEGIEELDSAIDDTIETAEELDSGVEELDETLEDTTESAAGLGEGLKALAAAAVVGAIISIGSTALDAFAELEKGRVILQNMSGKDFPALHAAVNTAAAASKGLRAEGDFLEAANTMRKWGNSTEFVTKSMGAVQRMVDSTGGNLNLTLTMMSRSISIGSDRFFRLNQSLVKYAGGFKALGAGTGMLIRQQREQFILNALQNEAVVINDNYSRFLGTTAAQLQIQATQTGNVQERVGELLNKAYLPLMKILGKVILFFGDTTAGLTLLTIAVAILTPIIGVIFIAAIKAAITSTLALISAQLGLNLSFGAMTLAISGAITSTLTMIAAQGGLIPALFAGAAAGWAFIAPWLPFIAMAVLVGLAIAGLILFVEDLWTFLNGGESIMGDLVATISTHWDFIKDIFFGAIDEIIEFVKIWGPRILTLLFPVAGLFFFFDEIKAFALKVVGFVMDKFAPIANILSKIGIGGGGRVQEIAARQEGGPVSPNQPFLVGERGPEVFVPSGAGNIVPAGEGGGGAAGGNTFNVTVAIQIVADASSSLKELIKEKVDELSEDDWRIESGLPVGA